MKFIIVGQGSMGKRRVRNLQALGHNDITVFDMRKDRREESTRTYGIKAVSSLDEVELSSFDVMIVSLPPDLHMEYASIAFDNDLHCFIEASVTDDGMDALIKKLETKEHLKFYASVTLRFHPTIRKIKEIVDSGALGKLSNYSYHVGQYLPDWHPWEDIKDFYVSKKETGACREIVPFEMGWLNWIFGDLKRYAGLRGKSAVLDADIDDTYAQVLEYGSGVLGTLVVDVTSRNAIRRFVLNGERGQLIWDWSEKILKHYNADEKRWIHYYEPVGDAAQGYNPNIVERPYIDEVRAFIDAIVNDGPVENTLAEDHVTLKYLYGFEASADTGRLTIWNCQEVEEKS